ncbi:MAG TPA: hypothetical protein VJ783_20030 [Pirellulales bacterium]|nr:hypothetical protein [Pirellulales bacterium]
MRIVLTKPAEYPDFVLAPGVIVDLSEQEAQRLVRTEVAMQWVGVPGEFKKVKRKPRATRETGRGNRLGS